MNKYIYNTNSNKKNNIFHFNSVFDQIKFYYSRKLIKS